MSGSYTASASINVQSNAPQVLASVARGLGLVDARIKATERNLGSLISRFGGLNAAGARLTALGTAADQLRGQMRAASQTASGLNRTLTGTGTAADTAAASIDRTGSAMMRTTAAARLMAAAASGAVAAMRGLSTTTAPRAPTGTGTSANPRGDRLGEMAALGAAARSGQGVVGRVVTDAGAIQTEQALLRAQTGRLPADRGMDAAAFESALMRRAIETAELVRGTTVAQNIATGNELRTVLGGNPGYLQNIIRLLPEFQLIAHTLGRASGTDPEGVAGRLGAALGLRGSFYNQITGEPDPERGMRELDMAGRMMFAYRGRRVNPAELELFQRRARVMGERMDPEAYFGGWVSAGIQNLSGNVFGTALNAFGRQMVNGIMPNQTADLLKQHGFIAANARGARVPEAEIRSLLARGEIDDEMAGRLRTGAAARFNRRHIINSDLAATRPDLFFEWAVRHLESRGIRTQDERDSFANAAGSTAPGRQLWSFGLNPQAIRADIEAVRAVGDEWRGFLTEGFAGGLSGLQASLTNLSGAFGSSAMQDVIRVMDQMTAAMNRFSAWARENPDDARTLLNIAVGLTGLATAGALFAAGSLAMSGLGALVAATGLPALSSALGGFAAGGAAAMGLTGAIALLSRLAAVAGGAAAFLYFLRPGETNGGVGSTPGMSRELEELRRQNPEFFNRMDRQNGTAPGAPPVLIPRDQLRPDQRGDLGGGWGNLASYVPPGGGGGMTIRVPVHLDGRRITEVVVQHMGRDAERPVEAAGRFDPRRALPGQGWA
ncbi:hypothetical protein ACE7GA_24380 [Roseomonas sp. CCTCC AB2023176]|uniref:hypothetical protein n=1 Tax=Roseomonas sp. CCTCC AB2023176 TaxID=3342640 RepID=UPI0035DC92DA